ncbi:hypothetical protein R6Z07F_008220 [Ovis aries]
MTLVFTLMLEMLLFLRAGAQSVTQPDDHITVSEGAGLELKCNYSSSVSPYLFWYVQYPNQGLQLLLKYESGDNLVSGIKGVSGMDVVQSPPALSLQEGSSSTLRCNFSTLSDNVQWYLQNPGGRLIHLFYIPSGTKQDGRLNATTVPKERHSSLHISSSQTTDSGTYFCAAQHSAPQAPAASTLTLRGLGPSSSHSHTVRPPQGIFSA